MSRIRFRFGKKEVKEKTSYHIDTVINTENKKLVMLTAKITGDYGSVINILSEINKYGKPILKMGVPDYAQPHEEGSKSFHAYFIIGDCGRECGVELKNIVNSLKGVSNVEVYFPENGYIFPQYDDVKFIGEESIVFTARMIGAMIYNILLPSTMIVKSFPLGSMSMLTTMGIAAGRQIYKYLVRYVREELFEDFEEYIDNMLILFTKFLKAMGNKDVEIMPEGESGRVFKVVMSKGAVECRSLSEYHYNGRTGYLTRGIIEGFFEELFDRRATVKEDKCINKRDKACIFIVEIMESR